MSKETTVLFGPWAPDFPAYGGDKIGSGGSVICEDAKGVFPTLGGYRPLVEPGTDVGVFTTSDFAEIHTPNTMPASAEVCLWLDSSDASTITTDPASSPVNPKAITRWENKITGSTDYAEPLFEYNDVPGQYCTLDYQLLDGSYVNNPTTDYTAWGLNNPQVNPPPGAQTNGTAMDVQLDTPVTGDKMWVLVLASDAGVNTPGLFTDRVLLDFGNDGDDGESITDGGAIRYSGITTSPAFLRSGTAAVVSPAVAVKEYFIQMVVCDGAEQFIRQNGVENARQQSMGNFDITRLRIGGRGLLIDQAFNPIGDPSWSLYKTPEFCWSGGIHEIVFGKGTLTTDDIERLEGWLAHKRGLTSLLPSGHTYKTDEPQSPTSIVGGNEPTSHGMFWSQNGAPYFFVGDYAKIWLLNQSSSTFDDVTNASTAYLASRDLPWKFDQFGNRAIAVTKNTVPQYYDLGTSSTFQDLPGSPPQARIVAQVRDFVFLGSLTESGVKREYRVRWSGFNDSEDWTTDPGGTQADFQDLDSQYGEVMGIVGGEYATVFQQRAITRFTYVGPPAIFQRDTVEVNRGTIAPHSVIQVGRLIYYYSHDGFWAFDGAASQRISGDQIHRWVQQRISDSSAQDMRVDYDPTRRIIMWAWPYDPDGLGRTTSGLQLIYNYESGQWSYNIDTQKRWWIVRAPPFEDYIDSSSDDIDSDSTVIDSEGGGFARTLALNYDGALWRLSELDGGDVVSRIETSKMALTPGLRSFITGGRVIGNFNATSTVSVAVESNPAYPSNTLASTSGATDYQASLVEDGYFPVRSEGRYHSVKVRWDGGKGTTLGELEELDVAQGVSLEYEVSGKH